MASSIPIRSRHIEADACSEPNLHGNPCEMDNDRIKGSVAKNRLKAERVLTIFSETFDE
jgi:hypothetical protein